MVVVMSIPAVSAMGKEASMQVLVRNSTHKIRTREPLRVSATVCLLKDKAWSMLDRGGCRDTKQTGWPAA